MVSYHDCSKNKSTREISTEQGRVDPFPALSYPKCGAFALSLQQTLHFSHTGPRFCKTYSIHINFPLLLREIILLMLENLAIPSQVEWISKVSQFNVFYFHHTCIPNAPNYTRFLLPVHQGLIRPLFFLSLIKEWDCGKYGHAFFCNSLTFPSCQQNFMPTSLWCPQAINVPPVDREMGGIGDTVPYRAHSWCSNTPK